jgi:hypothetical protein
MHADHIFTKKLNVKKDKVLRLKIGHNFETDETDNLHKTSHYFSVRPTFWLWRLVCISIRHNATLYTTDTELYNDKL